MKNIKLILVLPLISSFVYCQELSQRKIQKIESFGINMNQLNLENEKILNDLNFILKKNKKSKKRKVTGTVLASLSILSIGGGALILSQSDKKPNKDERSQSKAYRELIGGFFLGTGVIEGAISIPLFSSSKRKKNERDKMIKMYIKE